MTEGASNRVIVVDVETTGGTEEDRVVSLGMLELIDGVANRCLYLVFNPDRKSCWAARQIHGLSFSRYLSFQSPFAEEAQRIRTLIGDSLVAGHNVAFDVRMLNGEFKRCGLPPIDPTKTFCTMKIFQVQFPRTQYNLIAAAESLGIAPAGGKYHDAWQDAVMAAQIYQALMGYSIEEFKPIAPQNERMIPLEEKRLPGRPRKAPAM